MAEQTTGLVITVHPGDFVWRAGGAIAHLWACDERVALNCGVQGSRNTGVPMTYEKGYQQVSATVEEVWS